MANNPRSSAKTSKTEKPSKDGKPKASDWKDCRCMLGTAHKCTGRTLKSFARGHDARMSSRLAQLVAAGSMDMDKAKDLIQEAGGGTLLVQKMIHSAELRKERASAPKAPRAKAAKPDKATKPAASAASTPASPLNKEVKVEHGQRGFKATVVRNAAGDMVARHRFQGKDCDHDLEV